MCELQYSFLFPQQKLFKSNQSRSWWDPKIRPPWSFRACLLYELPWLSYPSWHISHYMRQIVWAEPNLQVATLCCVAPNTRAFATPAEGYILLSVNQEGRKRIQLIISYCSKYSFGLISPWRWIESSTVLWHTAIRQGKWMHCISHGFLIMYARPRTLCWCAGFRVSQGF